MLGRREEVTRILRKPQVALTAGTQVRWHAWRPDGTLNKPSSFSLFHYEQHKVPPPAKTRKDRTVLTPEAQQGIYRYTATDNSVRTISRRPTWRAALERTPAVLAEPIPYIASQLEHHQRYTEPGPSRAARTMSYSRSTFRFASKFSNIRTSRCLPERARRLPGSAGWSPPPAIPRRFLKLLV